MLGRYRSLQDHIAVHRYFSGLERQAEVPWPETVASWYDHVYMPVVDIIRQRGVLRYFPGRTEADLYLCQEYGRDVGAETATMDFVGRFSHRGARRWLADRLRGWKARRDSRSGSTDSSDSRQGAEDDRSP